jgi:hypothetical protein
MSLEAAFEGDIGIQPFPSLTLFPRSHELNSLLPHAPAKMACTVIGTK